MRSSRAKSSLQYLSCPRTNPTRPLLLAATSTRFISNDTDQPAKFKLPANRVDYAWLQFQKKVRVKSEQCGVVGVLFKALEFLVFGVPSNMFRVHARIMRDLTNIYDAKRIDFAPGDYIWYKSRQMLLLERLKHEAVLLYVDGPENGVELKVEYISLRFPPDNSNPAGLVRRGKNSRPPPTKKKSPRWHKFWTGRQGGNEYDVIVLGTGLKECIISGLLSVDGLKVLHLDCNDYCGGESTSLNLDQLWKRYKGIDIMPPAHLGSSRDFYVDMVPKFIMANGALPRVLAHTNVRKYVVLKAVDGSFVYNKGKIHKVPATDIEILDSTLMSTSEKWCARKFLIYVQEYNESDPKTHKGMDLTRVTSRELFEKFGLEENSIDFFGHILALHRDDSYLDEPALDTVKMIKLYAESLARSPGGSPYIYPLYGLVELHQELAQLCAEYGGIFMLKKPECKVAFDDKGKVCGVTSEGTTIKCDKVVCDPSYVSDKVRKVGKVARAMAIMSQPIPHTCGSHSAQVILPRKQLGRKSHMYVSWCSDFHNVTPKGKFIAFVSTEVETDHPESELKAGIDLLGPVDEMFFDTRDVYEPLNEPSLDNCFISTSYDATTHAESTIADVLEMYTKITGKVLNI